MITIILVAVAALLASSPVTLVLVLRRVLRLVTLPRPATFIKAHGSPETGVVRLEATDETLLPGTFGLWFQSGAHARVGAILSTDDRNRTVDRVVEHADEQIEEGQRAEWKRDAYPSPGEIGVEYSSVQIAAWSGQCPAWLVPGSRSEPTLPDSTLPWLVHLHGVMTTRSAVLGGVEAASALGFTSLVPSWRGDTEGPETLGNGTTLGQNEWADVDGTGSRPPIESGCRRASCIIEQTR